MFAAVVLFAVVFSYVIANAFTDVFEMVAEAMMVVFLEDYDANGKNMVGPEALRKLMISDFKKEDEGTNEGDFKPV